MTSLQGQVLSAINSIRPYLYGSGFSVIILKFNGTNEQYDELVTLTNDFITSFDRSGNITLMLASNVFDNEMREAWGLVFDGWIYQFSEPAKPTQGPFPMWKAVARPIGSKYIVGS